MNKIQLQYKLMELGIRDDAYSLEGGFPSEAHCLNQDGFVWEIYYSERGLKTGLQKFVTEEEACAALFDRMSKDISLRTEQ